MMFSIVLEPVSLVAFSGWSRFSYVLQELNKPVHGFVNHIFSSVRIHLGTWTDCKLGIAIQDPPPESGRRTHLLYFTDSYCILSRVWNNFTACFTSLWTSISVFYHNTARDVVTVLLIFAKYLSLHLHIFTCTYRGTHTQAHMYNQHTRGMATTRHRSLVGRSGGRGFVRDRPSKNNFFFSAHRYLKSKKIRANRASSKATNLFLRK